MYKSIVGCIHNQPFCTATTTCVCICAGCQYYSRKWLEKEADRVLAEAFKVRAE